jgi:short-subunit dehydrogenase
VPSRRVAVVTGASSGIGAAIARRLAAEGWLCVLLARREDRLRQLAAEIGAEYDVCDVTDRVTVEAVAEAVRQRHPAVDLLVNNAGIPARAGFFDAAPERIEEVMQVNYLGSVWCLRAFLPALAAAPAPHVVNIVSVAGTVAFPSGGPYSASKHAQLAFSRAVAAQLQGQGIRVHTVNPGFVETEGFPQQTTLRSALLRRLVIRPERIAEHVLSAIRHDRRETFVPAWYRVAALTQAFAPGMLSRVVGRIRLAREDRPR